MTRDEGVRIALAWLATYGLHSTLFLGGAWLLCALRPPRSNRNRERLWKLALVGGLLSATLQLGLGARPLLGRIQWSPSAPAPEELARSAGPRGVAPGASGAPALDEALPVLAERSATLPARERRAPRERGPSLDVAEDTAGAAATRPVAATRERTPPRDVAAGTSSTLPAAAHPVAGEPVLRAGSESAPPTAPGPLVRFARGTRASLASRSGRWPGIVLATWIAVGLASLVGLIGSWTCLRRRMLGREILRAGPLVEQLSALSARAGLRRRVRLSVSSRIATPFSTGHFFPEVCLPRAVTDLAPAQQEALLAHELAHLVRRDPTWFGVSFLIEKLFFFQPLNRIARAQLSELAELACDDWAVRWTGARLALASCLTEVAGWMLGEKRRLVSPPGLAGHRSRLGRRVERLLDDRRSPACEPPAPWWPPFTGVALAAAALAVPGVSAAKSLRGASPGAGREPAAVVRTSLAPTPFDPAAAPAATLSAPLTVDPLASSAPPPSSMPRPSTMSPPTTMVDERVVLDSELALLESELAALHAELEARELRERFAGPLARIDARMDELRAQHGRVQALIARLHASTTPAEPPEPPAESPVPSADPGESR